MDVPCQKIVWGVVPAIRAAIAVDQVGCGIHRTEAARIHVEFEGEGKESIRSPAQNIKEGRMDNLVSRTCELNRQIRCEKGRYGTGQEYSES